MRIRPSSRSICSCARALARSSTTSIRAARGMAMGELCTCTPSSPSSSLSRHVAAAVDASPHCEPFGAAACVPASHTSVARARGAACGREAVECASPPSLATSRHVPRHVLSTPPGAEHEHGRSSSAPHVVPLARFGRLRAVSSRRMAAAMARHRRHTCAAARSGSARDVAPSSSHAFDSTRSRSPSGSDSQSARCMATSKQASHDVLHTTAHVPHVQVLHEEEGSHHVRDDEASGHGREAVGQCKGGEGKTHVYVADGGGGGGSVGVRRGAQRMRERKMTERTGHVLVKM